MEPVCWHGETMHLASRKTYMPQPSPFTRLTLTVPLQHATGIIGLSEKRPCTNTPLPDGQKAAPFLLALRCIACWPRCQFPDSVSERLLPCLLDFLLLR